MLKPQRSSVLKKDPLILKVQINSTGYHNKNYNRAQFCAILLN